jgi:hypothetical protein
MATQTEDKWQNAREQAQAQFESIREMLKELEAAAEHDQKEGSDATCEAYDKARQAIEEDALSVEVRSDWIGVGDLHNGPLCTPAEYRILLCTGGPAVQITGSLNEHGEPESACLQMQDWFLPWMEVWPTTPPGEDVKIEEILLAYARQFYFGE